jgi:ABC-2 type transport system ATP-binding protein
VETRDLTRRYGETLALDHLNLTIPEGAIFGFIGPNGAGKTTTMRILTTLLQPSSGEARIAGISVRDQPKEVRKVVGFMPDFFGVYDNMKAWEYLDFFGRAYGVPANRRAALIEELLALVDLSHKRDDYVMGLSRGMSQRLSLARTMIHDPQLLILDEPASGLDPRARIELRELLKELRALGKTIMRSLQPHRTLEIRILQGAEQAQALLRELPEVLALREAPEQERAPGDTATLLLVDFTGDETQMGELLTRLIGQGVVVTRFAEQAGNLEDIFMQVTKGVI